MAAGAFSGFQCGTMQVVHAPDPGKGVRLVGTREGVEVDRRALTARAPEPRIVRNLVDKPNPVGLRELADVILHRAKSGESRAVPPQPLEVQLRSHACLGAHNTTSRSVRLGLRLSGARWRKLSLLAANSGHYPTGSEL